MASSSSSPYSTNNGNSAAASRSATGVVAPPPAATTCALVENGRRCGRAATSHNFSKRKLIAQKGLNVYVDPASTHTNVCAVHRRLLANSNAPSTSSASGPSTSLPSQQQELLNDKAKQIKLSALSATTLRRYKKFFKLQTKAGLNKQQLADTLCEHLTDVPVNEKQVIAYFIYAVKTKKNRLDHHKPD